MIPWSHSIASKGHICDRLQGGILKGMQRFTNLSQPWKQVNHGKSTAGMVGECWCCLGETSLRCWGPNSRCLWYSYVLLSESGWSCSCSTPAPDAWAAPVQWHFQVSGVYNSLYNRLTSERLFHCSLHCSLALHCSLLLTVNNCSLHCPLGISKQLDCIWPEHFFGAKHRAGCFGHQVQYEPPSPSKWKWKNSGFRHCTLYTAKELCILGQNLTISLK